MSRDNVSLAFFTETQCLALLRSANELRRHEAGRSQEMLLRSRKVLAPFDEPLTSDIGLNRWLIRAREETYSDWLQWLIGRMQVYEIALVFGLDLKHLSSLEMEAHCPAVREYFVEHGHEGHSGRIDILVQITGEIALVLELKLGAADAADTAKHAGYASSLKKQFNKSCFILLATEGSQADYDGFRPIELDLFCRNIRRLAVSWKDKPLSAALALIIVGAIEHNLLRMTIVGDKLNTKAANHLLKFIEVSAYE